MEIAIKSKAMIAIVLIAIAITAALGAVCSAEESPAEITVTYRDYATGEIIGTEIVANGSTPSMLVDGQKYAVHNAIDLMSESVAGMRLDQFGVVDGKIALTDPSYRLWKEESATSTAYYTIDGDAEKTAAADWQHENSEPNLDTVDRFCDVVIVNYANNEVHIQRKAYIKVIEKEDGILTQYPIGIATQVSYYGDVQTEKDQKLSGSHGSINTKIDVECTYEKKGGGDLFLKVDFSENFKNHEENTITPLTIVGMDSANELVILYARKTPAIVALNTTIFVDAIEDDPNGGEINPPNGGDDPRPTPTDSEDKGWTMAKKIGIGLGCAVGAVIVMSGIALMVNTRKRKNTRKSRSRR